MQRAHISSRVNPTRSEHCPAVWHDIEASSMMDDIIGADSTTRVGLDVIST